MDAANPTRTSTGCSSVGRARPAALASTRPGNAPRCRCSLSWSAALAEQAEPQLPELASRRGADEVGAVDLRCTLENLLYRVDDAVHFDGVRPNLLGRNPAHRAF